MKETATDVRVRIRQGIGIAHAISVGIYLLGAVSVTSIVGGIVLQQAIDGPHATVISPDSTNTVTLSWTAPGDDANTGTASAYDIRYSTNPLSEVTWSTASTAQGEPSPLIAGSTQAFAVTGLNPGTLYYFGLKTADEAGNVSTISNIATKRTDAQACNPTWSCTGWTDCRNGVQTRTCLDTRVPTCGTNFNRPIESQSCTTPEPAPAICAPRWSCSNWTGCVNGSRTRVCNDLSVCGTDAGKPETTFDCAVGGQPPANPSPKRLANVQAKGGDSRVKVYTSAGKRAAEFYALAKSYRGGLSVAGGDVTDDGNGELVVGTGVGSAPQVSLFTGGGKLMLRFFAFPSSLRTGVNVAMADVDGDGKAELIATPAGNYAPLVRVFRYDAARKKFTRMADISAQGGKFRGGLNLEAGDLDRNGLAEIVVTPATSGRGSTIETYQYNLTTGKFSKVASFSGYAKGFQSGIVTSIGDVDGDGNNELMTAPAPGVTDVRVYRYSNRKYSKIGSFMAGSSSFRGGVDLASLDVNSDGRDDVVTVTYSNGLPGIRVFTKSLTSGKFNRMTSPFPAYVFSTVFQKGVRLGVF